MNLCVCVIYVRMRVCNVCAPVCIFYASLCMYACIYICMCACMCMYECMYISICWNVQVAMSVCVYIYIYMNRKAVQSVCLTETLSHNRHRNTVLHGSGTFRWEIKLLKGRTDIRNFKVMSVSNYRIEFISTLNFLQNHIITFKVSIVKFIWVIFYIW